jgi:tetratricopeptide (TPR) repeat protein
MLAMNPTNTALLDTLALMSYEFQQYTSAALVSQDAAAINPDDALANEIAALSFDNLGLKERAVKYYERMYLQTTDVGVLYRMAFLQYELKRFNEATASVDGLIDSEETKNQKVYFPKEDKTQQEINLLAGAYRLKGMIEKELGNVENAKANLNKALEISPDFEIVKKQLAEF